MSTMLQIRYDADVDALYLALDDGPVSESIEVEESVYIDIDSDGRPIGIEFVSAADFISFLQRQGGTFSVPSHMDELAGAASSSARCVSTSATIRRA